MIYESNQMSGLETSLDTINHFSKSVAVKIKKRLYNIDILLNKMKDLLQKVKKANDDEKKSSILN